MIKFIDLFKQYQALKLELDQAIAGVIDEASFIGGSELTLFEDEFASYLGVTNFVGVANGTDALEIVLEALALPQASEIIVPANTFIADSEAVSRLGHKVVFCDCAADYLIDYDKIESLITEKTKAIIAVHLYGLPCDLTRLQWICSKYSLKLIEDCSQAHGAKYQGSAVGQFGDAAIFSFYPGKNLGAYGDAGGIATNSSDLAQKCRMIANHGRIDKYNHQLEGRNSRLDNLQAAVLRIKLRYLDVWINKKNILSNIYRDSLQDLTEIELPTLYDDRLHGYHLFVIKANDRNNLKDYLKAQGIETGIHYPIALPALIAYSHLTLDKSNYTNSINYSERIISLPLYPELSEADVICVASAIRKFYGKN